MQCKITKKTNKILPKVFQFRFDPNLSMSIPTIGVLAASTNCPATQNSLETHLVNYLE